MSGQQEHLRRPKIRDMQKFVSAFLGVLLPGVSLVFVFADGAQSFDPAGLPPQREFEEQRVYATVLAEIECCRSENLIYRPWNEDLGDPVRGFDELSDDTAADFRAPEEKPVRRVSTTSRIVVSSGGESKACICFSRVGFSQAFTEALVAVQQTHRSGCGVGQRSMAYRLRRMPAGWQVVEAKSPVFVP